MPKTPTPHPALEKGDSPLFTSSEKRGLSPFPSDGGRRAFLKALGLGAASLAACERIPVKHAMPYLVPPEEVTLGVPTFYASTCTACPAGCGTLVKVLAGRPVKLEGNPEHPVSRGGLCAVGQASLRDLYDPSRLQAPTLEGAGASWSELDAYVARGLRDGAVVRVVTPTLASPSARAAIMQFLAPYDGRLLEHDLDPCIPSAEVEANEVLFGDPRRRLARLDEVDLLVSFAADVFGAGPEPVAHTAAWSQRRRDGEPRHVQIEANLTLTGAAADERWLATANERQGLALGLLETVAARLGETAIADAVPSHGDDERVRDLAAELVRRRGRSVVVCGDNDLSEQVAVAVLNQLLGAPLFPGAGSGLDRELALLESELADGNVDALIVAGIDLVERRPHLLDAVARVPLSIAITDRANDTSGACKVVASAHQGLECWDDVDARGIRTLAQPTIRPLFSTRHPYENFLVWGGQQITDWRTYLEQSWQQDEVSWTELVRTAGLALVPAPKPYESAYDLVDESTIEPDMDTALGALRPPSSDDDGVQVELVSEVGLRAGSHRSNSWLRELPDPLTRTSWVPTIRIGPALAREQAIADGDVLQVGLENGDKVAMPARIVPGQHPGVLGVPVGYDDNAYRLSRLEGDRLHFGGARAAWSATGERVELPLAQVHGLTEDRPIVHQVEARGEHVDEVHYPHETLWPEREMTSPHWDMVIDLDACTGCSACVVSCQVENNIPVVGPEEVALYRDMHWLRMDRYFVGPEDEPEVLFEPMLCAQCDNAPCETVCPVAATVHSEDGLNQQVYNRCVGTRYCANNCPYKVRRFNWFDQQPSDPIERLVLNPDVVVRSRGVMEKCTFCVQRIQAARIAEESASPIDVQTACQQSCPAKAITFGDGADPESAVSRLKASPRSFQVLAELGVAPSVTYLARIRRRT